MAEKAFWNMEAISTSKNVVEGNIVSKEPKSAGKKKGRPKGSTNKKKKENK